jgi:formylglycine-generating enzyme required for sulfatase activity
MRIWSGQEEVAITDCRSHLEQRQAEDIRRKEQLVRSALREAGQCILHLEYNEAINFITSVMREGVKTDEIFQILLEIAFFWAECGQANSALSVLVNMEGLGGFRIEDEYEEIKKDKKALREYVRQLAGRHKHLAFLEERYYPKMLPVAGGDFDMGDEEFENARPVHRVSLSSFQIAETQTTNWQYGLYCAATGKNIQDTKYSWHLEGDNPVIKVSWYDAVAYANWLSRQQGLSTAYQVDTDLPDLNVLDEQKIDWLKATDFRSGGYRLPTEAEWEYAARGGADSSRMTKYAGSDDINEVAWYHKNSKNRTSAVKKLKANELGLFDMSGNVWEWCADFYDEKYYEQFRSSPAQNPHGPETGDSAVLRGGSWLNNDLNSRVARRFRLVRFLRLNHFGLRLARAASEGGR